MNKHSIIVLIFLMFYPVSLLTGQSEHKSKCDYIASGYYQLVYEAEIAYLEGNDSLAFAKLQEAEKRCPLINQPTSKEIELYCRLLMKNRQFDKAIAYMDTLANKYGTFPVNVLIDIGQNDILSKELLKEIPDFYLSEMPRLLQESEWYYYLPQRNFIIDTLTDICAIDQNVRKERNLDSVNWDKMKETDILNYKRLFQLIDKFGFPNTKLYGCANVKMQERLGALLMHITDHKDIADTILQFVREGQCEPGFYGIVIDRKILPKSLMENGKPMYLYAGFSNITDDEIIDIEQVDERRTAIGMPTREMERKKIELLTKRYEQLLQRYGL
ncbi:MAG: hypothetical protein LBK94_03220 [Prevotellaceae bacterium]|jgi:hypothetical protein|nr:hypothetical protein [Prevotellaceae bacterium]